MKKTIQELHSYYKRLYDRVLSQENGLYLTPPHSTYTPLPLTFPFPNDLVHTTYFHIHVSFTSLFMFFTLPFSLPPTLPFSLPCKFKGPIEVGSWSDINNTTGNSISLSDPLGLWLIQLLCSRKEWSKGSKVHLPLQSLPNYKQGDSYYLSLNQQQRKTLQTSRGTIST